ncbi:PLP-dependent aspartate aminotransferase family protein [Nereida sp. MMG025]|uniref:trans-sulfuration enzyme family protein n=1 Tax=Nereida sp. MMG025 TaxID=2909981 RepID=UPI001F3B734E|nr:aminotransferase class V-fold PLP-dependent enzyme [Nereida sp. MMG025]MCF6443315.1 aminotransferase class V-fold PLP-dependent enzyme [Nereida sp. MMG025]
MTDTPSIVRRMPFPDSSSRAVVTPLQPSVVYSSDTPDALDAQYEGRAQGYTYAREGHPNADVLARKIDQLEGVTPQMGEGFITGSGMAAISAVMLGLCRAGDHVLGGDQLYGRSLRMMHEDLPALGITTSVADPTNADAFAAAMRPDTKLVLLEVVSNPTLRVADIEEIAKLCRDRGVLLVIDNTFTTPRGFRAFDFGADVVVHSVTKLLAGHSDVTLGYVAARTPQMRDAMLLKSVTWGLTPSPFDCWLAERGLYSFELRFDRAQDNAARLADALALHPKVEKVLYPGRTDHPDHNRVRALVGDNAGNMVSFILRGERAETNAFVGALDNVAFAPTLGDIGTTLSQPATSSHRALSVQDRLALGMPEGFFRISVGVEDAELLIAEFTKALDAV